MLRSIATALLACLPLTAEAQAKPPYFTPEVAVQLTNYIGCPYVSSAVEVLRKAYDKSDAAYLDGVALPGSGKCVRYASSGRANASNMVVVESTLSTYRTTDSDGQSVQLHIHTYRQVGWTAKRYEYLVTSIPLKSITDP